MSDSWHKNNKERLLAYIKEYRRTHPEYVEKGRRRSRINHLLKRHNMTLEEFESKVQKQNNCCAICFKPMSSPHVDHNHKTGENRDLLCSNCNTALGLFFEDVIILQSAIDYINKHSIH